MRSGVIGCGMISDIYMKNLTSRFHNEIELIACSNRTSAKAIAAANKYKLEMMEKEELLSDPKIDMIINLMPPESHYEINREALLHGKHVYSEKTLASAFEEGKSFLHWQRNRHSCTAGSGTGFS